MSNKKLIAFYLPQFHPTKDNDQWWGKGFTEWTNVAKAKKLFWNHYQPHIPADLGFYDLRLPEAREAQANLAKEYGVYGFCYYHYWFQEGIEELEKPFDEVVRLGKPDFPFCLCWANETWYSKFWNIDGRVEKKPLAEQLYLGHNDNEKHFLRLLPAFKDKRYILYNNRLLFVIYRPLEFIDFPSFKKQWNGLARTYGLPEFFFVGYSMDIAREFQPIMDLGFDSVISCRMSFVGANVGHIEKLFNYLVRRLLRIPVIKDYKRFYKDLIGPLDCDRRVIPTIIPNWDHTPRSGIGGVVYTNSTPDVFYKHVEQVVDILHNKSKDNQLCFLKSWNEWGEGNYVEPDLKYGRGFLEVIKHFFKS